MSKGLIDIDETYKHAFERVEDGYIFHPWRWSKGYWVSDEEFEFLKARGKRVVSYPVILGAAMVLPLLFSFGIYAEIMWRWHNAMLVAVAVAVVLLLGFIAYAMAPQRLVLGRDPVAPRRDAKHMDDLQARTTPWWLLVGVPGLLLFQVWLHSDNWFAEGVRHPVFAIGFGLFLACALYLCARIALAKWRQRGE